MKKLKKLLSMLLSMSLIFGVFASIPLTAHAGDNVWYYFRYWISDGGYVNREIRYANAQLLQNMDDGLDDLYTGWYYSQGSMEFNDRVTVHGEVNIILTDSSYVKFEDGIEVSSGNTLNIYGQDRDDQYLEALAESYDAAIGSDDETGSCGNITIYGGGVKADSRGSYYNDNAGIGGGNECDGGNVTIYGGHVQAYGGANGAGIGGGDEGNGGSVTIYGGTVEAYGGSSAAGIGGGDADGAGGKGGTIRIYGGEITAKGGSNAAGIGGGDEGSSGDIYIYDGTINATGGSVNSDGGAGIGGGNERGVDNIVIYYAHQIDAYGGCDAAGIGGGDNGEGENITIAGGSVVATGGKYGAGIGGGQGKGSDKIKIQGGKTYARGGDYAAGVGGGQDGSSGTIEISGHVEANGGTCAAGIGGGEKGSGGTIKISSCFVQAIGGDYGAGIGGGKSGSSGTIEFVGETDVTAYGGINAAGIGGGDEGAAERITINGGHFVVDGGSEHSDGGAGIGGGNEGGGGTISITDAFVKAQGGCDAAGIGGGDNGEGGIITISKYVQINSTGGKYGAGIGGGQGKSGGTIEINADSNGSVTASGGSDAAGIGGGETGSGGTINIHNGIITAVGGNYAAGIGGGDDAEGGTITITGGTITAGGGSDGAGIGGGEDAGDGSITISGGTTTVKPAEGQQSLKGNSINLSDDSAAFKGICVRKPGGSTAPKNERISWCTSTDKNELVIAPCEHADCTFTYKDQGVHARSCNHCTCTGDAPHTLGTPVWNWANDYSSAAPAAVCTDCGRELSFAAAVTATAEDDRIIHTASFEYNNTVYTDVKESFADSIGAKVIGHSISLEGDIGVNFYMELADDIANSETAYMRFEIPGTGDPDTRTVYVKDARKVSSGDDTFYVFKCQVAAKEMTSGIKGQIVDGDRTGNIYRYSVKEYADYLLTHANADGTDEEKAFAKAADLVRRMLNYGAYSQIYFDKNPDILANESLSENDKKLGNVEIDTADPVLDTLPEGVTFEGATLSLKSETTLSLYFKSSNTLSFSCGGYTVETTRSGGYQIARIRGIHAARIGDLFTLNVNGAQVRYSPLNYCRNVLKGGTADEKLRNVAKALYQYWYAAGWYFDEQTSAS